MHPGNNKRPLLLQRPYLCAFFGLLLAGCAVGPDFKRPLPPTADHYNYGGDPKQTTEVGGVTQRFQEGVGPVANWWQLFHSKELDAAVTQGLQENPGVQAAQASLKQSQDNLRAGYGVFYPQLNAAFSADREKSSPAAFGNSGQGKAFTLTTLTATLSYSLDIFGGEHRAVESLAAQVDQQQNIKLGTYLILTGNIVNTLIATAGYQTEIDELERLIALQKEQITIAQKQYQAGLIVYRNELDLRVQLEAFQALLPPLRQRLTQSQNLLATLEGKSPAEWQSPHLLLTDFALPNDLPLSLPSALVRQRPDILAAEAQLHVASADIGVARAAMFPSFNLNATYGLAGSSLSKLLDSNIWGLGLSAAAPILNGGELSARHQAAIDAYEVSAANYKQTTLAAFEQVADSVRALEHDAELARTEAQAVADAELTSKLYRDNYEAGMVNYLQVLSAEIQYHVARINYFQIQAQQLQDTTALFISLGGGWWHSPVPG